MKKSKLFLSAMLAGAFSVSIAQAQTARLEVIHNAADAIAAEVDVYVNGGATPFIDDFAFRTSSGFVDVPAGVDLNIGIALSTSTGPSDILFTLPAVNLTAGETYIAIANGIVSPTGYMPNSTMAPFGLDVFATGRESATGGSGTNDHPWRAGLQHAQRQVGNRAMLPMVNSSGANQYIHTCPVHC